MLSQLYKTWRHFIALTTPRWKTAAEDDGISCSSFVSVWKRPILLQGTAHRYKERCHICLRAILRRGSPQTSFQLSQFGRPRVNEVTDLHPNSCSDLNIIHVKTCLTKERKVSSFCNLHVSRTRINSGTNNFYTFPQTITFIKKLFY
jgi:hypothetical protein